MTTERKLIGNFDAKIWAEEFVKLVKAKPEIATDVGTMLGWFANAIMAGYDNAPECLKCKEHKHNWQFVQKHVCFSTVPRIHIDLYEFVCECGKVKKVEVEE